MAQQHLEPTDPTAAAGPPPVPAGGDALASYLRAQATEFLRALRLHRETGAGAHGAGAHGNGAHGPDRDPAAGGPVDAARALRRAARRLSGTLHTFQPLLDAEWAEAMRPELAWLSGTLALEHAYASRLERLLQALHRLSGSAAFPSQQQAGRTTATASTGTDSAAPPVHLAHSAARPAPADRGNLTVGAAKAGALLDRQLTLARTRAHSTALQALGSSRFHAVADKVALLASEVPLKDTTASTTDLRPLAAAAHGRLTDAVAALPLVTAGNPYNAQALVHGLSPGPGPPPPGRPVAPGPPAAAPAPVRARGAGLRGRRPGRRLHGRTPPGRRRGPGPPPRRLRGRRGRRPGRAHTAHRARDGVRARGAPRRPAA
ncbi:hypothetical protein CJD44_01865 [Streptomyces sp. alain-838]|nr:hypothetical protein CJD44_01865 [Streptomyces sp. alain-838]